MDDKELLKEIIGEFETIAKIVDTRLKQLYVMVGLSSDGTAPSASTTKRSEVRAQIEQQRQAMSARIEEMRAQAMAQVQDAIGQVGTPVNMPSMPGLPGSPVIPGVSPSPGLFPFSPEEINEMRRQIMTKANMASDPATTTHGQSSEHGHSGEGSTQSGTQEEETSGESQGQSGGSQGQSGGAQGGQPPGAQNPHGGQ